MGLLLFAAVAAASPSAACSSKHLNPASLAYIYLSEGNLVPEKDADTQQRSSGTTSGSSEPADWGGGEVIGYTRLTIEYHACESEQRDYNVERRTWWRRAFAGKSATKALGVSAKISPLNVTRVASLARIERKSDGKGEAWDTSIETDRVLTPYFRIDRSSTLDLSFDLVSTRDYNFEQSKEIFSLIEKAANLLTPSTKLITSATKERFNKTADFVNNSVSGLLHVSVKEKARRVVYLQDSNERGRLPLGSIVLMTPWANDALAPMDGSDVKKGKYRAIGRWDVFAEPVRASLFGIPNENRRLPAMNLSSSNVLNFAVDEDKTIRELLNSNQGVKAARDALVRTPGEKLAEVLCRAVMAEADRLWFSPADSGAVAWAFIADLSLTEKEGHEGCRKIENYPS